MSKVLARRQAELQGRRAAAPSAQAREHDDILARIRSFFGLENEREGSRVTPR
jgi:hypothetical protein